MFLPIFNRPHHDKREHHAIKGLTNRCKEKGKVPVIQRNERIEKEERFMQNK